MSPKDQVFVSIEDESPRMFRNNLIDYFSRVHIAIIPVIYVPVISYFTYVGLFIYDVSSMIYIPVVALGILIWTLFEYWIHRLLFHFTPSGNFGKRVYFIMHGIHHDYPNDSKRLVMPPAISLSIALAIYWLMYLVLQNRGLTAALFSGFAFGYLCYDLIHYATHHSSSKIKWFERVKKNHMLHHYRDDSHGFGLSNIFWDQVFGTAHPNPEEDSKP